MTEQLIVKYLEQLVLPI